MKKNSLMHLASIALIGAIGCIISVILAAAASFLILFLKCNESVFSVAAYICICIGSISGAIIYRLWFKKLPLIPCMLCGVSVWGFAFLLGLLCTLGKGILFSQAFISLLLTGLSVTPFSFLLK